MNAEIITIGDEILIGQIVDTNSAWLGTTLGEAGITVTRITSIQDRKEAILNAVREALERTPIVLTTGGLGPTKDDITKHTLAELFGMKLVRDHRVYEHVRERLALRGIAFNELNRSQALVPAGCTVLFNRLGTAPGMWFQRGGHILASMPGVPFEMKALTTEELLPRLKQHFDLHNDLHRTAITFGLAESMLAERIAAWEEALPAFLHLAYLPSALCIKLRLSAYGVDEREALPEMERRFTQLETLIPDYLVGYGEQSVEGATGELLRAQQATLACAESCTGGNLAHRLTAMAGASEFFYGGVVAYSNSVKSSLLGVPSEIIATHGAVSREVAEAMAEGVRRSTGATFGLSTTGIAGPTGGTPEKPVGTVWIGIATPTGTYSKKMVFGSIREQNIERASTNAINLLRLRLCGFSEDRIQI